MFSNPNLLINPNFKINQRGFSIYTSGYTVDRWAFAQNTNASASVVEEGIIIDTHDSTNAQYRQITDKKYFYKETYITASLKFSDCISLQNTHLVIYVDGLWKANMGFDKNHNNIVTCSFLVPNGEHSIGMGVYFDETNIGTIINWTKLEYGNIATPFIPPDESTELIKCQRYYETNKETGLLTLRNNMLLHVFFKTTKRSIPNITITPNNNNLELRYIKKDGFQIQYTGEDDIDFLFMADSEI